MPARYNGGVAFGLTALAAAVLLWAAGAANERAGLIEQPQPKRVNRRGGEADVWANRKEASIDNGGGAGADTPLEIPARGWWAILRRVFSKISTNRLMTESAGITFYMLLSVFPALAALVSLAGLFFDPASISTDLDAVSAVVPGGGMDLIHDQIARVAATAGGALGIGLVTGLAISLWSANQGIKALFDSLNMVYGEHEKRGFFGRTALTLCFTAGALLVILLAMAFVVGLPVVLGFLGLGDFAQKALSLARWPVLLGAVALFLALVYRYGPSRKHAQWRWVTWGSAFAAIAWVIVSVAFSWYVANFGSYNKTYGSLGAVIGFMTWIWLSGLVVLIGAQLDAEMEHQVARDTTVGQAAPLGH